MGSKSNMDVPSLEPNVSRESAELEQYLQFLKELIGGVEALLPELRDQLKTQIPKMTAIERQWLADLLLNYQRFREAHPFPRAEARGELPIRPKEIYGEKFGEFLGNFLKQVLIPALGDKSHCVYLDLCIWDPFRHGSDDNWVKTKRGIDTMKASRRKFEEELANRKIPFSALLYKKLKKEILILKVHTDGTVDPHVGIPVMLKDNDPDKPGTEAMLNEAIKAHTVFKRQKSILYVYYIPSLFNPYMDASMGGLALMSKYGFRPETLEAFQSVIDSLLSKLGVNYLYRSFYDQSVRSAVSSIMARNMSHNIGSHVIPRATVSSISRRLVELGFCPPFTDEAGLRNESAEALALRILTPLKGRLDDYTQQKADFLAEITTEPLRTTRPAFFYREVVLPFIENTLLMDNIAANEGVSYLKDGVRNRLVIHVFINGRELKAKYHCSADGATEHYTYPDGLPYSHTCPAHPGEPLQILGIENGEHDVEVELPGPLGEFAFYSFLENYIRNSAKHNKEALAGNDLIINISIDEFEDDVKETEGESLEFYRVRVCDNVTMANKAVAIHTGGRHPERRLRRAIDTLISTPVIQPDGSLRKQAWGISEMKICAVLLRGPKDFIAAMDEEREAGPRANLLVTDDATEEGALLVYEFRLMKSKRACAVLPDFADGGRKEKLKKEGIWIFKSIGEMNSILTKRASMASFRFALFDCCLAAEKEANERNLRRLLPKFPFRVLVMTGRDHQLELPKCVRQVPESFSATAFADEGRSAGEMYQWLWRQWLKRWLGEGPEARSAAVNIYLDQQPDVSPTREWAHFAGRFNNASSEVKLQVYGKNERGVPGGLNDVTIEPGSAIIIYDRHRGLRLTLEDYLQGGNDWSYVLLEKHSPDFITLFSPQFPSTDSAPWVLPWELAEAGLLRVVVVDERATEFSLEGLDDLGQTKGVLRGLLAAAAGDEVMEQFKDFEPLKWHSAWAAKVYICTHLGVDEEPTSLHGRVEERVGDMPSLKMRVRGDAATLEISVLGEEAVPLAADAVLIHQGILDELRAKIPNFDQEKFLNDLRRSYPFVVVESGRGIPPSLSEKEKFLPFSLLQHSVLGNVVGKFGLARVLMSLARYGR